MALCFYVNKERLVLLLRLDFEQDMTIMINFNTLNYIYSNLLA